MITKELVDFIKKSKGEGKNESQIKAMLVGNGWLSTDAEEGFLAANPPAPMSVPTPPLTSLAPLFVPPVLNILPNNPQASVGSILGSINTNRPTILSTMPQKSHKGLIVLIVVVLLLIAGGVSVYVFRDNLKTLPLIKKFFPVQAIVGEVPVVPPPVVVHAEVPVIQVVTNCDNSYDCLITAATMCQPISGITSYSMPNPFFQTLDQSGQTKYEIKSSQDLNSCTLVYSLLSSSFSISDANRKLTISEGTTNAQIDAQLKQMNASFTDSFKVPTTCVSNKNIIISYLTDLKDRPGTGDSNISIKSNPNGPGTINIITHTTSTGQKLICT